MEMKFKTAVKYKGQYFDAGQRVTVSEEDRESLELIGGKVVASKPPVPPEPPEPPETVEPEPIEPEQAKENKKKADK